MLYMKYVSEHAGCMISDGVSIIDWHTVRIDRD